MLYRIYIYFINTHVTGPPVGVENVYYACISRIRDVVYPHCLFIRSSRLSRQSVYCFIILILDDGGGDSNEHVYIETNNETD